MNVTPHQAMGLVIAQVTALHAGDLGIAADLVNIMTRDELIGATTVACGWLYGVLFRTLRTVDEGCEPFHRYIEEMARQNIASQAADEARGAG